MQAAILDHLPDRLLRYPARKLVEHLDGPTLIHLPGRKPNPLFVSVIQHGNEPSGWDAIRRLLTGRYQRDPLPRSLALFIGNIDAAAGDRRHLPEQNDMNRGWPGTRQHENQWRSMLAEITRHMQSLKPYASIDIHNNTGENPHYAAINRISARSLNLASRFSRTVVYFTEPTGVQSAAFSEFCPSATLECGPPGKRDGTDHAMAFLENILAGDTLSEQWPHPEDFDLCQVTAVVKVPPELEFQFGRDTGAAVDLRFDANLDRLNFVELPPGTALAKAASPRARLSVSDIDGNDTSSEWTELHNGQLLLTRPAMPAMLTTRPEAIRQDCLCYLMERVRIRRPSAASADPSELPEHSSRPTSPDAGAR